MSVDELQKAFERELKEFSGEWHTENLYRVAYATDASAYQERPVAVAIPRTEEDIRRLIAFAGRHGTSIIPRTAGTSLAGQVVGGGIVVDVSKHFTEILEINETEGWARVQPGVIRNELNMALKPHGLLYGPETSTQNRAMIGGMVGNNSCGSNSVVYGSARDHLMEIRGFLSDGSEVTFGPLSKEAFEAKCAGPEDDLEAQIYRQIRELLGNAKNRETIEANFPLKSIPRRNTGYALDLLMDSEVFGVGDQPFNFCKLTAGSEGTLFFATEIKVHCDPLPPEAGALVCVHFKDIDTALRANLIALEFDPYACELIDHYILECTKRNIEQSKNRFFVEGEPGAILVVELRGESMKAVHAAAQQMESRMRAEGYGYHFPVLTGDDMGRIWELRKAGLGLLSNMPGDAKPVPVVEDTAVDVKDLPGYIAEFNARLAEYGLSCVHYAHAGSGEIHLRPILDLKTEEGNKLFRTVLEEIATLVKRYKGSLSGEHGDGRLRGEFIEFMVGPECYAMFKQVKATWDPKNVFNPGKIVDTPPMNTSLRYEPGQATRHIETIFNFDETKGILRAAEMCNGSGDCRKTHLSGGTMCPSYMATRDEKDTTRARANMLRYVLTHSTKSNPFDNEKLKDVMDLCISCKGCKSECPSNVDMAKLKAEFLQWYYDSNGVPFRTRMIANFTGSSRLGSLVPSFYNFAVTNPITSKLMKKMVGFASERSMPRLSPQTFHKWFAKHWKTSGANGSGAGRRDESTTRQRVYLFCDEFTNYNDAHIGIAAVELLEALGYEVIIPEHGESGRVYLSKGLVRRAVSCAEHNVRALRDLVTEDTPLVGIEPSAILGFRDEYPDLVSEDLRKDANRIAPHCLLFEEFFMREADAGRIQPGQFSEATRKVRLHGHCHQKAVASVVPSKRMLEFPKNYTVQMIPSGCCGMAGSFGYEKEHYDVSMKIGELVLLPTVRAEAEDSIIAAPGTSCRHQIKDGAAREALHPIEVLRDALKA